MMNKVLTLCLLAATLDGAAATPGETAAPAAPGETAPAPPPMATVALEGWARFTLPVPPGYEVECHKSADHTLYYLRRAKQTPDLILYSGFSPNIDTSGKSCYADIAGKRTKGHVRPTAEGGQAWEFVLEKGVDGAAFVITLPQSPEVNTMLEVLKGLQFREDTPVPKDEPTPDISTAPVQHFKCWGSFALPVPPDIRVVSSSGAESYQFHFIDSADKTAMIIYSGHTPTLQSGGKPVSAVIAGQQVEGQMLTGKTEELQALTPSGAVPMKLVDKGREFVLPRGTDGALYHIVVCEGAQRNRMLAMLAAMSITSGSSLSEPVMQQANTAVQNSRLMLARADRILAKVTNRKTADAAVPQLEELVAQLAVHDKVVDALVRKHGKGVNAYVNTIDQSGDSPQGSGEHEIQRVYEADCYGSEALEAILQRLMGMEEE